MHILKYFINDHLSKYGKMLIPVSTDDMFSKIGGPESSLVLPLSL